MTGTVSLPLLQRIQIASPCHERWEDMSGDERTRHCASCQLDVYNIAGMTEADAESLLRSAFNDDGTSKQRLCARIFRRADGTVITANCPVGLAAIRAKARRGAVRVAAALGITTVIGWAAAREQGSGATWLGCQPFTAVSKAIGRQPVPPPIPTGGVVCVMPTPAPTPPAPPPPAPTPPAPAAPQKTKTKAVVKPATNKEAKR
jgi:hypothetical protein